MVIQSRPGVAGEVLGASIYMRCKDYGVSVSSAAHVSGLQPTSNMSIFISLKQTAEKGPHMMKAD